VGVTLDALVAAFATEVGGDGEVTIAGLGTRGGGVPGVRSVSAPSEVAWIEPAEMTLRCGAATPMEVIEAALAEVGQCVAIPSGGTIGGALAVGRSDVQRLGRGPARDAVLQVRYVSAAGELVTAGGPTVKNVSGFDLCRLLVGSHGTLGFLAEVIVRTRPLPAHQGWFTSTEDPDGLLAALYRPTALLWDGTTTWALLAGHPDDLEAQVRAHRLTPAAGPPPLPAYRWSMPPAALRSLDPVDGAFVAEVGVGIVHRDRPAPERALDPVVAELNARVKQAFDPTGRLNPGVVFGR
jgi:glycolate oxidase FAD binding subunit